MAHKTGAGSTKNGRDSKAKNLGTKCCFNGKHFIKKGCILVRQRGLTLKPGLNVKVGKDFTLYSIANGVARISKKSIIDVTFS